MRSLLYEKFRQWWHEVTMIKDKEVCANNAVLQREGFKFYVSKTVPWYWRTMGKQVIPLLDQCKDVDVFGDVGASNGFYGLYMSPKVETVYSYEIDEDRAEEIEMNFKLNGYTNNEINTYKQCLENCDLIKIDIDGGELNYLRPLDLSRVRYLIVEMYEGRKGKKEEDWKMLKFLNAWGFVKKDSRGHNWLFEKVKRK